MMRFVVHIMMLIVGVGVVNGQSDFFESRSFIDQGKYLNVRHYNVTGALDDSLKWRAVFKAAKKRGKGVFIPSGIYQMTEDFEYDFGDSDIVFQGEEGTVLTTSEDRSIKQAPNIDLGKPKPVPGIYRVDVLPLVLHSDYFQIEGEVDLWDYISVSETSILVASDSIVISKGYVLDLDNREGAEEPEHDGLYVVSWIDYNYGGGYAHTALRFDDNVRVIVGSVVEKKNGVWSRYNPGYGLITRGNVVIRNVGFNNFAPFCISAHGTDPDKRMIIKDCVFEDVTRVLSWEYSGGDSGAINPGHQHKPNPGFSVSQRFAFNQLRIEGCTFKRIHTSIAWGVPVTKNFEIIENRVLGCRNAIAGFHYMTNYFPSKEMNCLVKDNVVEDFRNYSKNYAADRVLFRTPGRATYIGNKIYRSNGIQIYISGVDNVVKFNELYPHTEYYMGNPHSPIMIKAGLGLKGRDLIESNVIQGGGKVGSISIVKDAEIQILNNEVVSSSGINYVFYDTDKLIEHKSYIIRDTGRFKIIAGAVDFPLSIGLRVYYNHNLSRWVPFPAGTGTNPAILWAPSANLNSDLTIKGGYYEADMLFQSNTTSKKMKGLIIENVVFKNGSSFLQCDDADNVTISNCSFDISVAQFGFLKPRNNLIVMRSQFYISLTGKIELHAGENVHVSNCEFLPLHEKRYSELGRIRAVYPSAISLMGDSVVLFRNNYVSAKTSILEGIRIENCSSLILTGNYIDMRIDTTTSVEVIGVAIAPEFSGSHIVLSGNELNVHEKFNDSFFCYAYSGGMIEDITFLGNVVLSKAKPSVAFKADQVTVMNLVNQFNATGAQTFSTAVEVPQVIWFF